MEVMGGIGFRGGGNNGIGAAGWDPTEVRPKRAKASYGVAAIAFCAATTLACGGVTVPSSWYQVSPRIPNLILILA